MSRKESIQKRLQKVRPPRVQLTYDVEKGDAVEQKELPFVAGVLGDFAGQSEAGEAKLRDRKFVAIDVDNFDDVMDALAPRAAFRVKNRLSDEGGELAVDLTFRSFEDFRPESVARQVEPLRKLLEARARLAELRNKLAGNEKLDDLLSDVLGNTEKLRSIGASAPTGDSGEEQ
ncbi:MAG: type VI secretion system protein ImpB [Azoarcus sp.]|uniref:Type VI secretion system protein ImpB n=1 Tax=Aromatoleum tolulyticum TaxID=34027 RepID=A0A1N6X5C8_9RHOO|nr:type VI secretion system contractile sheath small subunit [Aromatoleum tolulyticum]MCK9986068.1 type VI secretion system protein ImpB [Azoarcus sp.]SIQ97535.1 type VI secretion system protein ImpB [Aromatoleum tolulyticum]